MDWVSGELSFLDPSYSRERELCGFVDKTERDYHRSWSLHSWVLSRCTPWLRWGNVERLHLRSRVVTHFRRSSASKDDVFHYQYFWDERKERLFLIERSLARICIPKGTIRLKLLQENHDCVFSGHQGRDRTFSNLSRHFYWPGVGKSGKEFVQSCESCPRSKSGKLEVGLLQPLPIPDRPWGSISMDYHGQIATTTLFFTFVDRLSKYFHLVPTASSIDAQGAARLYVDHIFASHSLSKTSASDRDPWFTSAFFKGEIRAICRFWVFDGNGLLGHQLIDSRNFEKNPPTESGLHGDPGLRFRRSFHSNDLSGAGARSIAWLSQPCVWSILLMYACTPKLLTMTFFCFLRSNDGTKTGICLLSFLLRSLWQTKTVLKPKKKRPCKCSSRLSGGLLVSEFFQSEKQRSLDDQRHWSDSLRWANRKTRGIVTQSLKWKRGPFSLSGSWYRTLTDVQTPIAPVRSITHKQTWLHVNSDVDCMRNSSHQV